MGKRASAVAVLLATSFFGSLLALVLVGRNPLVGPSTDLARTESLVQGVEGSPVTMPSPSLSPFGSPAPGAPEAASLPTAEVQPAPRTETDRDAGEPPGQEEGGEAVAPAPPPAPEPVPAAGDGVVSKVAPGSSEPAPGKVTGKAKGKGSSDQEAEGGGPDDGSNEQKGSKGPKHAPKGEKAEGPGKGPKGDKDKGSGNGAIEPQGKGKGSKS